MPWRFHVARVRVDDTRARAWCGRELVNGKPRPDVLPGPAVDKVTCDDCRKAIAFETDRDEPWMGL